jgi:CRISPR/Cas system CSM-associated protein Csm2 small subunit
LKKEGASEEEIQDELNIILTQQAYTQQRRGKETAEIYEKVLKTKYVTFLRVMQIVLQ